MISKRLSTNRKRSRFFSIFLLAMSLTALGIPIAKADTSTIYNTDDTYVSTQFLTTPQGSATNLVVGTHASGASKVARVLLKFDLSGIPESAIITDADIYLYCYNVLGNRNLQLYSVIDDSWGEGTAHWNNQPAHIALLLQFAKPGSTGWRVYSGINIDNFVIDEFDNDKIVSFKIKLDNEATGSFHRDVYYSKEYNGLDSYLQVTYTIPPEVITEFYGAGFNSSSPYVELHWTWDYEDRDFFEVQNSSDGDSWTYLGQNITTCYTDTLLVNGTMRYYRVRACNETNGGWDNSTWSDVNFEKVYFIPITTPGPTIIQNVTGEWVYYNLTTINVTVGTHDSGDLNSTLDVDGDTYDCSEVVGAPGYVIEFEWTDVDPDAHCLWVTAYVFYDGNQAHDIHIELYNFTSTTWVEIGTINDAVGFGWVNSSIYDLRMPNNFINSTGAVVGRFYHVAAGNINHDIYIEYLKLQAFVPFEDGAEGVIVTEQSFFWIFIAIVLSIIVGLLMWLKYEHNNN